MKEDYLLCPTCGHADKGPVGLACVECGDIMIQDDVKDYAHVEEDVQEKAGDGEDDEELAPKDELDEDEEY